MADRAKKISELTAANSAANTDYLLIVTNTAGTAVTKRINFAIGAASVFATGGGNTVLTIGNTTINGRLTTTGNTVAAQVNATSLNISGLTAAGNTTVTGFVNVSTYGTFGGTVNAVSLNISGLTSISSTGLITAPQVGNIIPFYYGNQAAFPSASSYHGAIAHSHSDGKMYFAHGGAWNAMVSDGTTANVAGLNISSNTINLNGVTIIKGSASTRLGVNTEIGSTGSNGSIYLSTAGKIYLKVANTGVATDDWQRVTTTAVD